MACSPSPRTRFDLVRCIVDRALPNDRVHSLEILEGGATNLNTLVRLEKCIEPLVLRTYLHGAHVCQKEVHLLKALQGLVQVPSLIKSDPTGDEIGTPYLIYRFISGLTFRQIRANGSPREMADAAHAIGRCLGSLRRHDISLFSACRLGPPFPVTENDLNSPLLRELLGSADLLLLNALFAKWSQVLGALAGEESLVHGDFNHRNIVLDCPNGRWEVAGILDWELAGTGSCLWDAARFLCYQKPDSDHWESHFIEGFRAESPGTLPGDWKDLRLAMNTLSAAAGLASGTVQERFIPELRRLVHGGLRGERIG